VQDEVQLSEDVSVDDLLFEDLDDDQDDLLLETDEDVADGEVPTIAFLTRLTQLKLLARRSPSELLSRALMLRRSCLSHLSVLTCELWQNG